MVGMGRWDQVGERCVRLEPGAIVISGVEV